MFAIFYFYSPKYAFLIESLFNRSVALPSRTILPVSNTYALSAIDNAFFAFCSTSKTVVPLALTLLIISNISFTKIGDEVSTYNLILPEAQLSENNDDKIASINETMNGYLKRSIFETYNNSYIYVERKLKNGAIRKGIVGAKWL